MFVTDRRKPLIADRTPKRTNVIDPESLTVPEPLANAAFPEATDVPEDIQSRLPSEAAFITTDRVQRYDERRIPSRECS